MLYVRPLQPFLVKPILTPTFMINGKLTNDESFFFFINYDKRYLACSVYY